MDVAFEDRLRSELRTSAEAVTVEGDLPARVDRRIRRRRRHTASMRVAAGVIVMAALVAGVTVGRRGGGDTTELLAPPVGSAAEGTWESLPEAPISARFQHAAVWTGDEMIVFGGYDGESVGGAAAYSPATGSWRRLAEPPGDVRGAPVAVWTGSEVVAFGGSGDDSRTHGAVYDPQADEWRSVASSSLGTANSSVSHVAWTGEQVLVVGAFGEDWPGGDGRRSAALYDPATDRWTELPDAPEALPEGKAIWTGTEMVVVGHDEGSGTRAPQRLYALALDPAARMWRTLPEAPLAPRGQPLVTWTGREIVVGGGYDFAQGGNVGDRADAAALDPATGTWRRLPDAPVAFEGIDRYDEVTVDGQVVAFLTADPEGRVLVFDPDTEAWRWATAPDRPELHAPAELPGRREVPVVSTGLSALIWGGGISTAEDNGARGCCRPVGEGAIFTPPAPSG
jgi:N-acetylneuraminic acid mutarotase